MSATDNDLIIQCKAIIITNYPREEWILRYLSDTFSSSRGKDIITSMTLRGRYNNYSWCILNWKWLIKVAQRLKRAKRIIDYGAGNGWITFCLNIVFEAMDVKTRVIAYEPESSFDAYPEMYRAPVDFIREKPTLQKDDIIICSWPSYGKSWAFEMLSEAISNECSKLVYIGEGEWGCCARDDFFELKEKYSYVDIGLKCDDFNSWNQINDNLEVRDLTTQR